MRATLLLAGVLVGATSAPASAQPAPGEYALWGPESQASLEVHAGPGGPELVRRERVLGWTAPRLWRSTSAAARGDRLEVVYAIDASYAPGLSGSLERRRREWAEVRLRATYRLSEGVLHELVRDPSPERRWGWATLRTQGRAVVCPDPHGLTRVAIHGAPEDRVDVVLISEGFAARRLRDFRFQATQVIAALRATRPFREYWRYLNVYVLERAAARPGLRETPAGTALGTTIPGGEAFEHLPRIDSGRARAVAREAIGAEPDVVVLLTWAKMRSVSDTPARVVAVEARTVGTIAPLVTLHELGHALGDLDDEYEELEPGLLDCELVETIDALGGFDRPNVTTHTDRERIPWAHWVRPRTPLPTPPDSDAVGLFEGANRRNAVWFRPTANCRMRQRQHPFCPVCVEALVLGLSELSYPLRARARRVDREAWRLEVRTAVPGRPEITWYLDGRPIAEGPTFVARAEHASYEGARLACHVVDRTALVRRDDRGLTRFGVAFRLEHGGLFGGGLVVRGPYRLAPGEPARRLRRGPPTTLGAPW